MEELTFHVTCGSSKKLVKVHDKDSIIESIYATFDIGDAFGLQVYNTVFNDWVDVESLDDISGNARLLVIQSVADERPSENLLSASTSVSCIGEGVCPSIEVGQGESTTLSELWPLGYKLPVFPRHVVHHIDEYAGNPMEPLRPQIRKEIINILFNSMKTCTLYPSTYQYREVGLALVRKFPVLKDRFNVNGCTHKSWSCGIKSRYKEYRRRMTGNEKHEQMKKKFGGKRKKADIEVPSMSHRCKKIRSLSDEKTLSRGAMEDEFIIAKHLKVIQEEFGKKLPNESIISDRLKRCFHYRRKAILTGSRTAKVLDDFPCLTKATWVISEMTAVTKVDVLGCLKVFTSSDGVLKKIKKVALQNWTKIPESITKLFDEEDICWIFSLSFILREQSLICEMAPKNPYPALLDGPGGELSISVDGCLITGISSYLEGLAALVSCYWAFNLEFDPRNKNFLHLLCAYLLDIPGVQMPLSVVRFVNSL